MTRYQDATVAIATASAAAVLAAYTSLQTAGFIVAAARLVARYNVRAVALADVAFAGLAHALPLGLTRPDDDEERLVRSFTSLVQRIQHVPEVELEGVELGEIVLEPDAAEPDPPEIAEAKVRRIARGEPLDAGRIAFHQAMVEREAIGWTRKIDADPCELCAFLADGKVLPVTQRMYDHPGCNCVSVPIFEEGAA